MSMSSPEPDRLAIHAIPADLAACRALLRGGSRSFQLASYLLPPTVREPVASLYAFCRMADDAIDGSADPAAALAVLSARLDRIYRGEPMPGYADRAFADVVSAHALPRALPEALFEGFAWDAEGRRYRTIDEVEAYALRVAGAVGMMMAVVMGVRDPAALARASDLGIAMQLSNIARDIAEDARAGRLYLPEAWLLEVGVDPAAWLARPVFDERLATVARRLVAHADRLYRQAACGIALLPGDCRPAIRAASALYAAIGHHVARRAPPLLAERVVVSGHAKAALLLSAMMPRSATRGIDRAAPAIAPAQPLIEAVIEAPVAFSAPTPRRLPWWRVGDHYAWVLRLFEALERAERGDGKPVPV